MLGVIIFVTAVLVVIATSILKNVEMTKKQKNIIATVTAVIGGSVAMIVENGGFDNLIGAGLFATILAVYGSSQLIYKFLLPDEADDFLAENVGNTVK